MSRKATLIAFITLCLAACSPPASSQRKPTATNVPAIILTGTAEAAFNDLNAHEGAVRFVSYNVKFGGEFWDNENQQVTEGRLPYIMEVINNYNPDVLVIQEANAWNRGDPIVAQTIADELGMNFVYCTSNISYDGETSLDNVLFSRFEIIDFETYPDLVELCAIRARVAIPGGS